MEGKSMENEKPETEMTSTRVKTEMTSTRVRVSQEQADILQGLNASLGQLQTNLNVAVQVVLAGHGIAGPVQVLGFDDETNEIEILTG